MGVGGGVGIMANYKLLDCCIFAPVAHQKCCTFKRKNDCGSGGAGTSTVTEFEGVLQKYHLHWNSYLPKLRTP